VLFLELPFLSAHGTQLLMKLRIEPLENTVHVEHMRTTTPNWKRKCCVRCDLIISLPKPLCLWDIRRRRRQPSLFITLGTIPPFITWVILCWPTVTSPPCFHFWTFLFWFCKSKSIYFWLQGEAFNILVIDRIRVKLAITSMNIF